MRGRVAKNNPVTGSAREALAHAYRSTAYTVDRLGGAFVIRIGEASGEVDALLRESGETYWAFVTANNPGSERLSAAENRERSGQLRSRLQELRYRVFPGRGVPQEAGWIAEESFLILGIPPEEAIRLGAAFGQNAVVLGSLGKTAELAFCPSQNGQAENWREVDEHGE